MKNDKSNSDKLVIEGFVDIFTDEQIEDLDIFQMLKIGSGENAAVIPEEGPAA